MQKNHAKRTALALFLLFAVTVSAQAAKIAEVIPIGHTVGIKMQAEGVLIVQLTEVQGADGTHSPAKEAGVQEGDVLRRAGETALHSNDDLQKQVALSAGQPIKLTLERGDAEKSVTVTPCRDKTGAYRIGVLARDSLAGIGTLTYVDPQTGAFGSLGHGICDSETGVLLPLQEGTIIHSTVSSVQRGKAGEPGSLQGEFSTEKALGTVAQNTESGIFGTMTDDSLYSELQCVPVASADEIKVGDAEILSNVDGDSVQRYSVQIVKLYPSNNPHSVEDFRRAGALAAVIRQGIDAGYINGSTGTIYGKTLDEMTKDAKVKNANVIHPFDNPYYKEGGLAVLRGNLAPDGCVIKTGGVVPEMLEHTGRAVCYDSEIAFYDEVVAGKSRLMPGDCVVIRYEGPVAGPGMREMLTATHMVRSLGLSSTVSLITDGRFSGGSVGGVIGHVSPEACKGGLIGLIEDGDIIEYSIPKGTIELKVDEATLAERRAKWVCPPPKFKTGLLAQYAALAAPAPLGARMIGDMSSLDDLVPVDF